MSAFEENMIGKEGFVGKLLLPTVPSPQSLPIHTWPFRCSTPVLNLSALMPNQFTKCFMLRTKERDFVHGHTTYTHYPKKREDKVIVAERNRRGREEEDRDCEDEDIPDFETSCRRIGVNI